MGRAQGKKTATKKLNVATEAPAAQQAKEQQFSASDLLDKAEELQTTYQFELALQFALRALQNEPQSSRALEIAASLELELGLPEEAHQVNITLTYPPHPKLNL